MFGAGASTVINSVLLTLLTFSTVGAQAVICVEFRQRVSLFDKFERLLSRSLNCFLIIELSAHD
jgi:hypothetical protein